MTAMILSAHDDLGVELQQQARDVPYYSRAWLDLLTGLYGYKVFQLETKNSAGQLTGFLPLCAIHSPLTGRRLVALPFSDYCPLLAVDETSANRLVEQAIQLAHEQRARYLELRTGQHEILACHAELAEGNLYVRWLLELPEHSSIAWSRLRKPVQHQVKKARKQGVQVRMVQKREEVKDYYRLHLQLRSKKHGMPAQPERYFLKLWDTFAPTGAVQILLAEYQGMTIAGMVLLKAGATMVYAYGASDERYVHLAPNNLLMWETIQSGCEQGCTRLDMGRTARDNEGLMEYKRRWGAIAEPMPYYYYPAMKGLASTSESSSKFRLLTACWRALPLPVAGFLGGHLYRHMG